MAFDKVLFEDADTFVADLINISDTLSNLTYLIELDAQHPRLVREYAQHVNQLLDALGSLLESAGAQVDSSVCS